MFGFLCFLDLFCVSVAVVNHVPSMVVNLRRFKVFLGFVDVWISVVVGLVCVLVAETRFLYGRP